MTDRLRTWKERVSDMAERQDVLAPLGKERAPAVLFPATVVRLDPEMLVYVIRSMTGHFDDEPIVEPTQDEIDEWMCGMMDDGSEDGE